MTQPIPKEIADRLQRSLADIAKLFKASRITIIVRAPEDANAKGNLILSNDTPKEAMEALHEHMVAQAKKFAAEGARSGQPGAEWPKHGNIDEL